MPCWAYYPPPNKVYERPEEYSEHVLGVLHYMANSPLLNGIVGKVNYLTGMDEGYVRDFILLGGLFHDVGKAWTWYQIEKRALTFNGHEVISFLILLKALENLKIINYNNMLRGQYIKDMLLSDGCGELPVCIIALTLMPILSHHYAFGEKDRVENAVRGLLNNNSWRVRIADFCMDPIENSINNAVHLLKTNEAKSIANEVAKIVRQREVELPVVNHIASFLRVHNVKLPVHIAAATLSLLNEADGRVAMKNRRRASQPS